HSLGFELRKAAERDLPRHLAGRRVDGVQLTPRRILARPRRFRIPEPEPRGIAGAERRRLGKAAANACARAIVIAATTTAAGAPSATLFEISPLAGVHHVGEHVAETRLCRDAAPIPAADGAGKNHGGASALLERPRRERSVAVRVVLVPEIPAERRV